MHDTEARIPRSYIAVTVALAWVQCLLHLLFMPLYVLWVLGAQRLGYFEDARVQDPFTEWACIWRAFWTRFRELYLERSPYSLDEDERVLAWVPNPPEE